MVTGTFTHTSQRQQPFTTPVKSYREITKTQIYKFANLQNTNLPFLAPNGLCKVLMVLW